MGYSEALEAAGAKVKQFKHFGSYQGTWMALLEDGRIVTGSYGSCSGCDAFEAEFGYSPEGCEDHEYSPVTDCSNCQEKAAAYQAKLAEFGKNYLNSFATYAELLAEYTNRRDSGDYFPEEDQEVLDWLKTFTLTHALTRLES